MPAEWTVWSASPTRTRTLSPPAESQWSGSEILASPASSSIVRSNLSLSRRSRGSLGTAHDPPVQRAHSSRGRTCSGTVGSNPRSSQSSNGSAGPRWSSASVSPPLVTPRISDSSEKPSRLVKRPCFRPFILFDEQGPQWLARLLSKKGVWHNQSDSASILGQA